MFVVSAAITNPPPDPPNKTTVPASQHPHRTILAGEQSEAKEGERSEASQEGGGRTIESLSPFCKLPTWHSGLAGGGFGQKY